MDDWKATLDNCNAALQFAFFHGRDRFNELRDLLNKALQKHGRPFNLLTFGELLMQYKRDHALCIAKDAYDYLDWQQSQTRLAVKQMNVVSGPIEQIEEKEFRDDGKGSVQVDQVAPTVSTVTNKVEGYPGAGFEWTPEKIAARRILIAQGAWTVAQSTMTLVLTRECPYFDATVVAQADVNLRPFNDFVWFRGDLKIEVQVSGTRFHAGRLMVAFVPGLTSAQVSAKYTFISQVTGLQHVIVDPAKAGNATMIVPWQCARNMMNLPDYFGNAAVDHGNFFGTIAMWIISPLVAATGVSQQVNYRVYSSWENSQFLAPRLREDHSLDKGDVRNSARRAIRQSEVVRIAQPALPPEGSKLSVQKGKPRDSIVYGKRVYLKDALQQMTATSFGSWNTDMPAGTIIGWDLVTPLISVAQYFPNTLQLDQLEYLSAKASYWSGSIKYCWDFVASGFHRGTVAFVYVPGRYHSIGAAQAFDLLQSGYAVYFELDENNSQFTVEVPFMSSKNILQVANIENSTADVHAEMHAHGIYALIVVNPLSVPDNVVGPVPVLGWRGAGTDFKLYGMGCNNLSVIPVFLNGIYKEDKKKDDKKKDNSERRAIMQMNVVPATQQVNQLETFVKANYGDAGNRGDQHCGEEPLSFENIFKNKVLSIRDNYNPVLEHQASVDGEGAYFFGAGYAVSVGDLMRYSTHAWFGICFYGWVGKTKVRHWFSYNQKTADGLAFRTKQWFGVVLNDIPPRAPSPSGVFYDANFALTSDAISASGGYYFDRNANPLTFGLPYAQWRGRPRLYAPTIFAEFNVPFLDYEIPFRTQYNFVCTINNNTVSSNNASHMCTIHPVTWVGSLNNEQAQDLNYVSQYWVGFDDIELYGWLGVPLCYVVDTVNGTGQPNAMELGWNNTNQNKWMTTL
jgi:hypothetical protein